MKRSPWVDLNPLGAGLVPGELHVIMAKRKTGKSYALRSKAPPMPVINDGDRVELVESPGMITPRRFFDLGHLRNPGDPEPTDPPNVPAGTRGKAYVRDNCKCCVLVIFDKIAGLPRQVAKERLRRLSILEQIAEAAL